jgi:hypothetical protein
MPADVDEFPVTVTGTIQNVVIGANMMRAPGPIGTETA